MVMPWGRSAVPTGGAGVALPAGSCKVRTIRIFLATGALVPFYSFSTRKKSSSTGVSRPKMLTRTLTLFRSGLTSSTVPMNSANGPSVTRTLWPFVNGTRNWGVCSALSLRSGGPELGGLDAHVPEDLLDLVLVERDRLAPNAGDVRAADEAGHARRVPDYEPRVGVEDHLDQDVSGVHLLL